VYVARQKFKGKTQYFVRESYRDGSVMRSRDLCCLGTDPSEYIVYPGGNACYVDQELVDKLCALNVHPSDKELDDVFWPFLRPDIRRILEPFQGRAARIREKEEANHEKGSAGSDIHLLDRRRICYLKCGHNGPGMMKRFPRGAFKKIAERSRDEIEQYFITQEYCLPPDESKAYIYAIFDIQKHFTESFAAKCPQWLDQEKVEASFLEEVCRLCEDPSFLAGENAGRVLSEYLSRYVIMFFDSDYVRPNPLGDYVRDFMNRHRRHDFAARTVAMSFEKASAIFGVPPDTLRTATRRGLTRLYRRMAQKLHPDKGGSHQQFVELTEAYRKLMRKRPHIS
jgi:hypothetical protein